MNRAGSNASGDETSCKDTALRFLSYRPRSVQEVTARLFKAGFAPKVINSVIESLIDQGYVNDIEFAEMWLRSRTADKPSGRIRIYYELLNKGVDKNTIELVLQKLTPETEEKMAALLIEKKISCGITDFKKLEGFLLRRGFQPALVRNVVRAAITSERVSF